jgi:ABC-type multidrug transport system permease subunit
MTFVKGFGRFWYDFLIGDDWKIAVAVVTALLVGVVALLAGAAPGGVLAALIGLLLVSAFVVALVVDVRRRAHR